MRKYEIIIYWSEEDEVFVADVPELPGCQAHGDTQEIALKNAQQAIQLWIDTANEFGDPVPEPKGPPSYVCLTEDFNTFINTFHFAEAFAIFCT